MKSQNPLVSIITITLGRPDLIHRCIESVQHQTYDHYEHIVVDASGNDETKNVVDSYHDPHIVYLRSERGPQRQMLVGFQQSKGEYITMLDDDDEYVPTKIEKQLKLIQTLPSDYGLVYCWMTYYDTRTGEEVEIHKSELRGYVGDLSVEQPVISGTPTMFYKREVLGEFGGTFDDSHGVIMSDWELLSRITQKYKVDYVPESLVKVYIHHGHVQLSYAKDKKRLENQITFHTHFLNYFASVFANHPERRWYHLTMIARNQFKLHHWRKGCTAYKELVKIKKDIRTLLLPISSVFFHK